MPLINVWEETDRFRIEAEVPGVSLDDIELQVSGRTLFIKTGRVIQSDVEKGRLAHGERALTRFIRAIPLPADINVENVEATLVNGVLELTLMKVGAEQRRTIRVTHSSAG